MSEWVVQVAVVGLFSLACGLLAAAWTHRRLGAAAIALFVTALAVWSLAFLAISAEWRDANSFSTCDDDCTGVHYLAAVAFIAPPLLIALAGLAMLVARGSRWRLRRTRENHS